MPKATLAAQGALQPAINLHPPTQNRKKLNRAFACRY